jgi:hypothetical protein
MSAPWKDDQLMEQQQELMKLQAALDIQVAYSANLRRSLLKATTVFALDHVNRIAFEKLCSEAPSQSLLRHDADVIENLVDGSPDGVVTLKSGKTIDLGNWLFFKANQLRQQEKELL